MISLRPAGRQNGFTIVELMIATLVFSVILVVITAGVLSFTRSYYKGVTAANTQTVARETVDEVTQKIQFTGQSIATNLTPLKNGSHGFCVGDQRYSYLPGWQLTDGVHNNTSLHQNDHVFVRDTVTGGCSASAPQDILAGVTTGSTELLSPHMRVANIVLSSVDQTLYSFTIRVVYGDDDLLTNPTGVNATCRLGISGSQFCAVSQLHTIVQRRVN